MKTRKRMKVLISDIIGVLTAVLIFIVPFLFMFINSLKSRREANLLRLTLPEEFLWGNYVEAFSANHYQVLTAFKNSSLLTLFSVIGLVVIGSMAGYVVQRRNDRIVKTASNVIMLGLMIPAAILPTIWVMQRLHIYKSMFSMIMLEIALQIPFTIMLYRGFIATVPQELEEAALIDGCSPLQLFFRIVFPLLKPVSATVIILNACKIFNDFTNPLYFFPGADHVTVQMTLYNYIGQYNNAYQLLFADVIIITIPMLIIFILFNRQLVAGMTAGAVKG